MEYQLISSGRGAKSTVQRCGLIYMLKLDAPGLEPQFQPALWSSLTRQAWVLEANVTKATPTGL